MNNSHADETQSHLDEWFAEAESEDAELVSLRTENRQLRDVVRQSQQEKQNLVDVINLNAACVPGSEDTVHAKPDMSAASLLAAAETKVVAMSNELAQAKVDKIAAQQAYIDLQYEHSVSLESLKAKSAVEALELAQEHAFLLSIPDSVIDLTAKLGKASKGKDIGAEMLRLLAALQSYAMCVSYADDFRHWCEHSTYIDAYPSSRTGPLSEDDMVTGPIVGPGGRLDSQKMNWSVRLPVGKQDIMRLYFFDDTAGLTGKIHIGHVRLEWL